jgi:hypothetical protein
MTDIPGITGEAPAPPLTFRNRRPGLIGCGVVHLLFGFLTLLMAVLMVVAFFAVPKTGAASPLTPAMAVSISLMYLAGAALFITLGIGSMAARRWAPPLITILSAAWLIMGLLGGVVMLFILPQAFAAIPAEQRSFATGCMAVMFGLFGIVVPAIFFFFYRSKHVKATVERLDPVPRWTDRIPMPLLAFALWMFAGAASLLFTGLVYRAFPYGSFMLRGWQLIAVQGGMAVLLAWAGIGTLKRQRAAWWTALAFLIFGIVYGVVFLPRMNYEAWYQAMNMPVDRNQLEMMKAMYSSPLFYVWMASSGRRTSASCCTSGGTSSEGVQDVPRDSPSIFGDEHTDVYRPLY